MQCRKYRKDRASTMDNPSHTRCDSKLSIFENYITMNPILEKILDKNICPIPATFDEKGITGCIDVFWDVRGVARALQKDLCVPESRVPRLFGELSDTLNVMAARSSIREVRFNVLPTMTVKMTKRRSFVAVSKLSNYIVKLCSTLHNGGWTVSSIV